MALRSVVIAVCVLVLAAGASPVLHAQQNGPVIAPRDVLTVAVFGEPTMSGRFTVDVDGAFEFPLVGRVVAAGLTVRGLERRLVEQLTNGFLRNPQVTVDLEQMARVRVFVMGEVRSPGTYQLTGQATLIEALTHAGSTTAAAAMEVLVLRSRSAGGDGPILPADAPGAGAGAVEDSQRDTEVIRIDLRSLQSGDLFRNNVALHDGDTVFVPRVQYVYITGHVRSPGAFTVEPGMTVLQALSLAGGLTDRGAPGRIRIIRTVNGQTQTLDVRLTDSVEPGDTIEVRERFF